MVLDFDSDPAALYVYALDGKSFSHTFQVDATYPVFEGMTFTAAYRWTDAKTMYGGKLLSRPLTNKYKCMATCSYKTPLELWQFDVTLQLNGGGRIPFDVSGKTGGKESRFHSYPLLNMQVTRWFRHFSVYAGGENITGYKQKNPVIGADNPWGDAFDSTMIWGPVQGAMFYIGLRWNLKG